MKALNVVAVTALLTLAACDWDQAAFLDALPTQQNAAMYPRLEVLLGVDGVSREALDEAVALGAFTDFERSTLVPMYPATSDASWSRLLHAPPIAGYEYTFFDPQKDVIEHPDLLGLVGHALPPSQTDADFPYYRAFDMHGSGYTDALESYADPTSAFSRRLDDLFVTLGGRVGNSNAFAAYLVELDVVAHGEGKTAMVKMLTMLSARIRSFRSGHPEVDVRFTLLSDHGSDHTEKTRTVDAASLFAGVGVTRVDSMAAGATVEGPWAVAEEHSRTTYGVAHTEPRFTEEVAERLSRDRAIDVVVARGAVPTDAPEASTKWVALFRAGERIARIGFDEASGDSWLERSGQWSGLGLTLPGGESPWVRMSDAELFAQTETGEYPDLVFRARTSLEALSVRFPADIVYSLKSHCVMAGFQVPGTDSLGGSGSHGALGGGGSRGVVISQSRALPATVRSDDVLALFPVLQAHVAERLTRP